MMNPLKWLERRTFLRGSEAEYPPIKSVGTSFGCTIQVHKLRTNGRAAVRLRVHQISDVHYYDLSGEAVRLLRDQLAEVADDGKGSTEHQPAPYR